MGPRITADKVGKGSNRKKYILTLSSQCKIKLIERPGHTVNIFCFCTGFRIDENRLKSMGLLILFLKECDACRGSFILRQTVTLLAY